MKIKLRFAAAGPGRNHDAGDVVDFPQKEAVQLVQDGMADPVDAMPAERADLAQRGETTEIKREAGKPSPSSTAKP